MDWNNIWNSIVDWLKNSGVVLLSVVLALIAGIVVIKIIIAILKKVFSNSKFNQVTISFVLSFVKFCLYVVLLLILADMLGIPITGFVALLTTAGLAVGLALQDSLGNLAAGLIMVTTKPFYEGDFVKIADIEGKVKSIKMLTTTIITLDNKKVIFPNNTVVNGGIINYTARGTRRADFIFSVAYESDIKKVRKIILDVMKSNGLILTDPEPFVGLNAMGECQLDIFCYCWCDAEDYLPVCFYVKENVFNEFNRNGISIPFPQVEVRMRNDKVKMIYPKEQLPERVEKIRDHKDLFSFIKFGSKAKSIQMIKKDKNNKAESENLEQAETNNVDKNNVKKSTKTKAKSIDKKSKVDTEKLTKSKAKSTDKKGKEKTNKTNKK